ncbi:MAG: hypothetical protein J6I55_00095 [Ruminococcus sp.]|nr:hypothetical protein [Ruminococcus sp.]
MKCEYGVDISLDVGFMFPAEYNIVRKKAINGEYGDTLKNFLEVFPMGEIDVEKILTVCRKCGNIETVRGFSMYVPKENVDYEKTDYVWSVEFPFKGVKYVTHNDLISKYDLFEKFNHKCSKCSGDVDIISNEQFTNNKVILKCPKCKIPLVLDDFEFFD